MKRIYKAILIILILIVVFQWLDYKDYFSYDFKEISKKEQEVFEWKSSFKNHLDHRKVYKKHFDNEKYKFPRQNVSKIKLLEKDKLFKSFWVSRTLKKERVNELVGVFNNPNNFDWGETTWGDNDIDYIFKFYNESGQLVGKVDVCYHDCRMVKSKPFTPNMKYGELSIEGVERLFLIIYKLDYWN